MTDGGDTRELLARWHAGDEEALATLVERHRDWIESRVRRRLGAALRAKDETQDVVQDAVLELLRYAPRFAARHGGTFRRLVARIVENVLRDRSDWFTARRRAMSRERPLAADSVLWIDPPVGAPARPDDRAAADEAAARMRLALELLGEEDRRVVVLRDWDGLEFARIGERTGARADAVRMRYHRALLKLAELVDRLRAEGVGGLLGDDGDPDPPGRSAR
ncbi:MAG: RNA polymerase sigma factor [Planctomycetota bacterium JB042]